MLTVLRARLGGAVYIHITEMTRAGRHAARAIGANQVFNVGEGIARVSTFGQTGTRVDVLGECDGLRGTRPEPLRIRRRALLPARRAARSDWARGWSVLPP